MPSSPEVPGITYGEDDSIGKQMLRWAARDRDFFADCADWKDITERHYGGIDMDVEVQARLQEFEGTWGTHDHFTLLKRALDSVEGFNLEDIVAHAMAVRSRGNRAFFIGNGGSAAIASHMAIDWTKNGKLSSFAPTDGAALTCLANDIGFNAVYSHQLAMHARHGDMLFAISSSGQSENIVRAAWSSSERGIYVVTLSGFSRGNPLSKIGSRNIYVPSTSYGVVEITHLACLHAVLDKLANS